MKVSLRDFSVLPYIKKDAFPRHKQGVYVITDADHLVLYIGCTVCLYTRMGYHERETFCETKDRPAFIYYLMTGRNTRKRYEIERKLIKRIVPLYNKQHNSKRYKWNHKKPFSLIAENPICNQKGAKK